MQSSPSWHCAWTIPPPALESQSSPGSTDPLPQFEDTSVVVVVDVSVVLEVDEVVGTLGTQWQSTHSSPSWHWAWTMPPPALESHSSPVSMNPLPQLDGCSVDDVVVLTVVVELVVGGSSVVEVVVVVMVMVVLLDVVVLV